MRTFPVPPIVAALAVMVAASSAQVPQILNYQGKIKVSGNDFTGSGQFKFALVNAAGNQSYWSSDGTTTNGTEPASAVTLPVQAGLYSVLLGDTTVPQMAALPPGVFGHDDVRLRVWFSDGVNGWQQMTPDQRVAAVGYAMMAETVPDGAVTAAKIAPGAVTEAALAPNAVVNSLNAAGYNSLPAGSTLLSTQPNAPSLLNAGYVAVGSIDGGEKWTAIAGGTGRDRAATVWSGTEMLAWGDGNEGWRYNPVTNVWTAMNTVNQPAARIECLAVWTGTQMIVWGGYVVSNETFLNTGGRYNPATNTWTPVSTANAPSPRYRGSAVWTGSEMIVWGGANGAGVLGDGAAYNPATDTWRAVSAAGAPAARYLQTAVWSGTEMLVWGGATFAQAAYADGAKYNPATGVWTPMAATGTNPRFYHTSVWTGSEMIVWGGESRGAGQEYILFNTGARYKPSTNTWAIMNVNDVVPSRFHHTAVWTGNEMIVWGGYISPYNPAVYTSTGGRYSPSSNTWLPVGLTDAASPRSWHNAVWTGSEMVVWGGTSGSDLNTGGRYRSSQTLYMYQHP
ncbi:MAG: galactose oxidase [Verrucomicrobiota bacterium]